MAERDDRLRPGRLLLLGALLAVVFLLLIVLLVVTFGPEALAAVRDAVGVLWTGLAAGS
ncbi:MAG: hypothetical protein ABEJ61_08150 [Haloferacaceae archaeon]